MRGICSIILFISISAAFAIDEESNAVIWYDGHSFYKPLNKKKSATVFFQNWDHSISQFLEDDNYRVALQLNARFDPVPTDNQHLPGIQTLAAVEDQEKILDYLTFLERYGKTHKIDYLVLPDTSGLSSREKDLLARANRKAPHYFIQSFETSTFIPQSKKEVEGAPQVIWIVDQSVNTAKLSKWSRRQQKRLHKSLFKSPKESTQLGEPELSEELLRDIYMQSVVAVDGNNSLPIRSDAIIYLGEDDKLRKRLAQYATVYDRPQINDYPVILDKRMGYDGRVFGNEIILDFNTSKIEEGSSSLLIPQALSKDDTFIAKILFGAQEVVGKSDFEGGRQIKERGFIGYSFPEYERMNGGHLSELKDYINEAIQARATPGSQLSVVKNGSIVLEKSYGYYTYDSLKELSNRSIFDLASVTKVVATLPAIALLVDQGKITLEDSIGMHLEDFRESNKSHVTIKELLAHNGGIRSYIPFWRRAMTGDRLDAFYYKTKEDEKNDVRTYGIEPHPALKDSLRSWIQQSDLIRNQDKYNYSDLGYMILHMVVESVSGQSFDQFVKENFYEPMNLGITFNPRANGKNLENIVPTEFDSRYRKDQVWGEVHDRNAHAFGGVAGHAGLFSNSSDLAKMMFMLSNGGFYQGKQYLKTETLEKFNRRYFENNRRGLGWDKKDGVRDSASGWASDASFGHTGFTGTMVWADPVNDLIFVFLSNRIYPNADNSKLMELNTRTEIHDVIYESILND